MIDIQQSTLVKGGERDFMLGLMRAQVYRQGVPAGTSAVVADKVGFLNGYLNDAAIVYHPNGTYVISVMTSGASWGKIAEITRKIEGIMY
jgi:beta-lactamase class A